MKSKIKPKQILILLVFIIFLILLIQNIKVMELNILFWTLTISRVVLIIIVYLLGIITGLLIDKVFGKKRSQNDISKTEMSSEDKETE